MKIQIICDYCGNVRIEDVYDKNSLIGKLCGYGNCRHKDLIFIDLSTKTDYYQGSPPFPPKEQDHGWPYSAGGFGNPMEGID